MTPPPFQFDHVQTESIRIQKGFRPVHAKNYDLPTVHLAILTELPQADHSCRSCGISFIQQMPGQGPLEVPIVIPCGHICGSRCLERLFDTAIPKCLVCERVLPLKPRGEYGIHGRAEAGAPGLPANNARAEAGSIVLTPAQSTSEATIQQTIVQIEAAIQAGSTVDDINAANLLLEFSASGPRSQQAIAAETMLPLTFQSPGRNEEMEQAIMLINRLCGVSVSLETFRAALMRSNIPNETKAKIGDILRGLSNELARIRVTTHA